MTNFVQELQDKLSANHDFFMLSDRFYNKPVQLVGFGSLIDLVPTKHSLQVIHDTAIASNASWDEFKAMLGEVSEQSDIPTSCNNLLRGKLLIYFDTDGSYVITDPVPKALSRSIESPINENVFQGSMNAFTEEIHSNIGIVRKHIVSDKLRVNTYLIGTEETTEIALLYYEGRTNMDLVHKITRQIAKNKHRQIENLQQLSKSLMGTPSLNMIARFNQSELPQEAAGFLRKGRAILLIDRLPFALIIPGLLLDILCLDSDRNLPVPIMLFLRTLRFIGTFVTIILPGLYVALVSVNPEVLRIEMALSIAQSREGVPYPAIVEILLMLLILELIIEASVRLPKNTGPTVTMVGGIILGQAVVQAKLVSNLLIIILAATTIANSTIVGLQHTVVLRLSKYLIVVLAAIFGVLGILEGLLIVIAYLASLHTYGIPYVGNSTVKDEIEYG